MNLAPLLKLPKNGEDWGKLIVAKGFKKLPKIQNIAQSGHTECGAVSSSMRGDFALLWQYQSTNMKSNSIWSEAFFPNFQPGL